MYVAVYIGVVLVNRDTVARIVAVAFTKYHTAVCIKSINAHPLPRCCVVTSGKTE